MSRFRIMVGLAVLFLMGTASAMAQGIQGVQPELSNPIEIGVGYTFNSFNETPSATLNGNGFTASAVMYDNKLGVEAQVSDVFGTSNGKNTQLLFGGAGIRGRWRTNSSLQPWVHVVLGVANLSPQTPYGDSTAFGYKIGGGVDYTPHHSRFAFRASADLFGSRFFSTYQLSPEITAGIVFIFHR